MAAHVDWSRSSGWNAKPMLTPGAGKRRAAAVEVLPAEFLAVGTTVVGAWEVAPSAGRRAATGESIDFRVDTDPGEVAVVAVRHPSNALTFHAPIAADSRRGARASGLSVRFRVVARQTSEDGTRRGIISKAIKIVVLKVAEKIAQAALPVLAAKVEAALWKKAGRKEGWLSVTRAGLRSGTLSPAVLAAAEAKPSLLLLHGTFSNTASAYKDLAESDFFDRIAPRYENRIYAFDHFTISRTPEENARMLLADLPSGTTTFDVITHSRGGLVLRNLVERRDSLGAASSRFSVGRAVLVASPNEGTPLATPERWEETLGWYANLLEVFPENPFTTGAGFVAEGLSWLAQHVAGNLPGLAAMDGRGESIATLNSPPGPPAGTYFSLAANFIPASGLLARLVDAGVDAFFASANDLVVPTEGGWSIDRVPGAVRGDQIGCFGPGGNLGSGTNGPVHHVNFFRQPETRTLIARVLVEGVTGATAIDTSRPLATRRSSGTQPLPVGDRRLAAPLPAALPPPPGSLSAQAVPGVRAGTVIFDGQEWSRDDTLQLMVMDPLRGLGLSETDKKRFKHKARLIAAFNSANVAELFQTGRDHDEEFVTPGPANSTAWDRLIAFHRRLKSYVDGDGLEPTEAELIREGTRLFDTLFPGGVRRLYDEARSRNRGRKLNVVLTSEIPWVADLPWEFAYDPTRRTFLATEEIHFVRNALTAVPAEVIVEHAAPLRLLVAVAQPIDVAKLSADEERGMILRAFQPLVEAGVVSVEVLPKATPPSLHDCLSAERFDVLHFIGHGQYNEKEERGELLFEDEEGHRQPVTERQLREIICGRGLRLVFLNACETGRGGGAKAEFNSGVAPALIGGGIPAVVANQFKVLDAAATAFAQRFYWCLAHGLTLGQAARESRIGVNYSGGESIDWAVPVLYAHNPEARLCKESPLATTFRSMPVATKRSRDAAANRSRRIAIWDIKHSFPVLEEVVARLNSVQSAFGFELVSLSVPSGTLSVEPASAQSASVAYLHAPRVARKLKDRMRELRRDTLICVTDLPMRDERTLNLYSWTGSGEDPDRSVTLLSTWGFDLPADGAQVFRFFGNNFAAVLAGQLAHMPSHKAGDAKCPLYYNPDRSLELLVGRQRFDRKCLAALKKALRPSELEALNALLAAFD